MHNCHVDFAMDIWVRWTHVGLTVDLSHREYGTTDGAAAHARVATHTVCSMAHRAIVQLTCGACKMAIQKLINSMRAVRVTVSDGPVVKCTRTVKPDNYTHTRYVVEWTFDFTNVSTPELQELAVAKLVIDTQREWRGLPDAERTSDKWAKRRIAVREMLDRERSRGKTDPVASVARSLGKMSPEQLAQIRDLLK